MRNDVSMDEPTCKQCGLAMSIVRISDTCGRCHAERILRKEREERKGAKP